MDEIDAMKTIAVTLDQLTQDERKRVAAWAVAKYGLAVEAGTSGSPMQPLNTPKSKPLKLTAKHKPSKKSKSVISIDKNLNLSPSGKTSAAQFAAEKKPANAKQKCVVAAYYLREVLGSATISVSSVYTVFKTLGWPLPADLKNMLSQAGSEGWLDTADFENIQVTTMGENLIEHSLPPKEKGK